MPDDDPSLLADPGGEGNLTRWVGQLVADEAARARARAHWLRRQGEEEGTFAGVLADLAERGRAVVVVLGNGRVHRGRISLIATDFVVLRTAEREVLVRLDAIESIQTMPRESVTSGDRAVTGAVTLAEAVAALAEERTRVLLMGNRSDAAVRGELRAVGRDVATVRLDGDGGTAYVALASVVEVSPTESG